MEIYILYYYYDYSYYGQVDYELVLQVKIDNKIKGISIKGNGEFMIDDNPKILYKSVNREDTLVIEERDNKSYIVESKYLRFYDDKVLVDLYRNSPTVEMIGYVIDTHKELIGPYMDSEGEFIDLSIFVRDGDKIYEHRFTEYDDSDYCICTSVDYVITEVTSIPGNSIICSYMVPKGNDNKLGFLDYYGDFHFLFSGDIPILNFSENGGDNYYPSGYVELNLKGDE